MVILVIVMSGFSEGDFIDLLHHWATDIPSKVWIVLKSRLVAITI